MSANHSSNDIAPRQENLPVPSGHDVGIQCGNCSTNTMGSYCHTCGQPSHVHHSLPHLVEEAVHGLWHFDAKGWRTIPLLIAYPGQLTRRYIDGQRVRFISPLGLFLFLVFFMFYVWSFSGGKSDDIIGQGKTDIKSELTDKLHTQVDKANIEAVKAQADLDSAKKAGKNTDVEQKELDSALANQKVLEENLNQMSTIADKVNSSVHTSVGNDLKVNFGGRSILLEKALQHAKDNPELLGYKLKNNAYKFALILVPLSLPFLWIVFLGKKNITMFDHAVFTLYSLSFMALLASVISILGQLDFDGIAFALFVFVPPIHMFRQLKGTYGLSNAGALWRTAFLCAAACLMVLIFILFVAVLSIV